MTDEPRGIAEKRLVLQSMRRGIREMDLILSAFSRSQLATLSDTDLALYDGLLDENDHDIFAWICGRSQPPVALASLIARISMVSHGIARP